MNGRLLLFAAAPLFLLYTAVAGNISLPLGNSAAQESTSVRGTAIPCPDGRSLTAVFELDGSRFHVLGALASIQGRAAIVSGPTGDVPVTLSDAAPLATGLVIGEPADATGSVDQFGAYVADNIVAACTEPTPQPTPLTPAGSDEPAASASEAPGGGDCRRGPGHVGDLRLEVSGEAVEIKRGTVMSFTPGVITVKSLGGSITVMITGDTKIIGDLSLATEVRVKGDLAQDGSVVADRAWAICPNGGHHGGSDRQGEGEQQPEQNDDQDEGSDS